MSSPPSPLARPTTMLSDLVLRSSRDNDADSDKTHTNHDLTNNHNQGNGVFNNVRGQQHYVSGNQNNQCTNTNITINIISFGDQPLTIEGIRSALESHKSSIDYVVDIDELRGQLLPEPYQSFIEDLIDIRQLLLTFRPSASKLQDKVTGFIPIVVCVAKAIRSIRHTSPRLNDHTFFSDVDLEARKYGESLGQLRVDIKEFHTRHGIEGESLFDTPDWHQLYRQVDLLIEERQQVLKTLLGVLLHPECRPIVGDGHAELAALVTSPGFASKLDITASSIDTIWIQDPIGSAKYGIPLKLCACLQDITLVVQQYLQDGPASEYIARRDWEMVGVHSNEILEETNFKEALKANAVFDISIIFYRRLLVFSVDRCPQCNQENDENGRSVSGEWRQCQNTECSKMFRLLISPTLNASGLLEPFTNVHEPTTFRRVSVYIYPELLEVQKRIYPTGDLACSPPPLFAPPLPSALTFPSALPGLPGLPGPSGPPIPLPAPPGFPCPSPFPLGWNTIVEVLSSNPDFDKSSLEALLLHRA